MSDIDGSNLSCFTANEFMSRFSSFVFIFEDASSSMLPFSAIIDYLAESGIMWIVFEWANPAISSLKASMFLIILLCSSN